MKRWTLFAAIFAAGAAVSAVVAGGMQHHRAHGHGHGGGHEGFDWFLNSTLDDLDATDAQRARVTAVKDRMKTQLHTFHDGHEELHAAFLKEWGAEKMDSTQLHGLVDAKLDELRGAMHGVVDGVVEIHDTLTPDQRRRLVARIQEMHGSR